MAEDRVGTLERRALDWVGRKWKLVTVLWWLGFCALMILSHWSQIHSFGLPDTDDNMRIMQVRAWLQGQGWYDLRSYRMNPPYGADIHWSRLVDLPIAGLILALRPFLGGANAERWACAIAPMIPYVLLLYSVALTARRLVGPTAYLLAFLSLIFASSNYSMFAPERIDHHGWQLALLALSICSIADPKAVRGGIMLGVSTALSLAIGLEMIIYLALVAVAMALFWVENVEQRERLAAYGVSLGGATAFCFLVFASNANWYPVCDALSPVWLSDAVVGGALMFALALVSQRDWRRRLVLGLGAGIIIAGFHALTWPHCLSRPEGISPEVERLWLSHVKEARPFYTHGWRVATLIMVLPATGLVGWTLLIWWRWRDKDARRRVIAASSPAFAATLLLLWQTRTAPAAQMMAVVGSAALITYLLPKVWLSDHASIRVGGASVLLVLGSGAAIPAVIGLLPTGRAGAREKQISRADDACSALEALKPVAMQPRGVVLTFVDLSPRLITVTPHDAISGPYHRNGRQIADTINFWRGSPEQAHTIARKYGANYVLSCPNSSTTTIFDAEAPSGFYEQLTRGDVPNWLTPVNLPQHSPYRMWRVIH